MRWYDLPDLLPPVYSGIRSMYETADTENTELKEAYALRNAIMRNFFVQTCDIKTLQYWEGLLGIDVIPGETVQERRDIILLYLVNNWQITKPYVEYQMYTAFGAGNYLFEYDSENNLIVHIGMYDTSYPKIRQFMRWFEKVCPAHIKWDSAHIERSDATNHISAGTTTNYSVKSSCTMSTGADTLYLGSTSYSVSWVNL